MSQFSYQVQRSANGTSWSDIGSANGTFDPGDPPFSHEVDYIVQSVDTGDYLRLKVTDSSDVVQYSPLVGRVSGDTPPPSFQYPYPGSAFYKEIPVGAVVHPNSQTILSSCKWRPSNSGYTWLGCRPRPACYVGDVSAITKYGIYVNWPSVCATSPEYTDLPIPAATTWAQILNDSSYAGQIHGDANLAIVDSVNGIYWETWRTSGPGYPNRAASGGPAAGACNPNRWNCAICLRRTDVYDPDATAAIPGGTAAAKLALVAGCVYPQDFDDLAPSSVIPHAFRAGTFCGSNGTTYPKWVAPAIGGDGPQPFGIPMGARVRLKPTVDVNNWNSVNVKPEPFRSALRKILRTLQTYGLMVTDTMGVEGAGQIECISHRAMRAGDPAYANYYFPWEDPSSNVGWGYGNGVPYDLMNPIYWDVLEWRDTNGGWTGA